MSATVANIRMNPDKAIVDDVTLPGGAGRPGPTASGAIEPIGTMALGTTLVAGQAIEAHQDTVVRGTRSTALRMKIACADDKPFTTIAHDAKKRPIADGIPARINGGKTFNGVVAQYPPGQKPCRATRLPVCM